MRRSGMDSAVVGDGAALIERSHLISSVGTLWRTAIEAGRHFLRQSDLPADCVATFAASLIIQGRLADC